MLRGLVLPLLGCGSTILVAADYAAFLTTMVVLNGRYVRPIFANKYADYYPDMKPPLDKGLVVAGGILHDIGKLREMEQRPEGAAHTAEGSLIGHILIGRDMVRDAAAAMTGQPRLDADTLLRLEHLIIAAPGPARLGLAEVADDARGPAGPLRRRHRREVPDDDQHFA